MGSLSRLVVLDTETTGLKPEDGHRVIEIGCIEILGRRPSGRRQHFYLNPERAIDEAAIQVHGLTLERLAREPVFAEVAEELLGFLKGACLVIHNAPFDMGFLNAEFARLKMPGLASHPDITVVDSLEMARQLHPGQRNSLDALCSRYNVSNSHRQLHGALLDAELLAEVYLAMTRGQESLAIATTDDDPSMPQASDPAVLSRLRVVVPSPQELSEHAAYLQALAQSCPQGPVWTRAGAPS
jgi:DNA polymerase III subunit epsilon